MRLALFPLLLLLACKGDDDPDDSGGPSDAGPIAFTDVFEQTLTSPVDILWVIDGGWDEGNDELTSDVLDTTFETLLLADPNWRIGILDSAAKGNAFGLIRNKFETWPYPTSAFNLPSPGGPAKVRDAIYTALFLRLEHDQNKEFIRSDAHLYVLVYTDKGDASEELDEEAFQMWLREFQPSNSKRLSAITTEDQADYWADQTLDGIVVEAGSFRKAIETVFLDAIGQRTEFALSYVPLAPPEVAKVVLREHATTYAIDVDYTYDAETNKISFLEAIPPADSQIVVEYSTEDEVVELTTESEPAE